MIQPNATELQARVAAHREAAKPHIEASRQRQAQYTAAQLGVVASDPSVVLDTGMQRIYRMRKGILTASRLINNRLSDYRDLRGRVRRWVPLMVTMTYASDVEWQPEHVSNFLNGVQKWASRQGVKLPYCWVMELTKKGKPHYHCIIWIPARMQLPAPDKRGWWPHGMTNVKRATNPYGYLSKYASKAGTVRDEEGKILPFPKGARIHGIGGITKEEARIIAWWKLPKDLRLGAEGSHVWRRRKGGGWHCIEGDAMGQIYECEWGLSAINTERKLARLVRKSGQVERISYEGWTELLEERRYYQERANWVRRERQRELDRAEAAVDWWGGGGAATP